METKLIITPDDSMWWILRPEFTAFVDKIVMSPEQFKGEKNNKNRSGYHKTTWDRLEVLMDNNLIEIKDLNIDEEKINDETSTIIHSIFHSERIHPSILEDTIFAYEYWIEFNQQKLDLVPEDQDYHRDILKSMPLWKDDLKLLKSKGNEAFLQRPEIIKYGTTNIIKKVLSLKHLNESNQECPLTGLKEYEPFLKYIELNLDAPLLTERTAFTYKNQIPSNFIGGSVHLPVEPEYDFMRFKLSKLKFNELLKSTFSNYKDARKKANDLLNRSEEIAFNLSEGKLKQKVTDDFLNINKELLKNHRSIRKNSKYLSYCFFGLSLIPIPPIAALFGLLGLSSKKISEYVDSAQLYMKGITPNGLSTYYSFNESLMDISKLDKFPDVQKENKSFKYDKEKFWR
jgi:hypothetical protein